MKRLKTIALIFSAIMVQVSLLTTSGIVSASNPQAELKMAPAPSIETEVVQVYVFERDDCGHCIDQRAFFAELSDRTDFVVVPYNLADEGISELFGEFATSEGLTKSTPITLIGNRVIQGFDKGDTTGVVMLDAIEDAKFQPSLNFEEFMVAGGSQGNITAVEGGVCDEEGCELEYEPYYVSLPFMDDPFDIKQYSLPVLSLVLGFIDGFNPCAMWVLVTFLLILVQVGDRKKMWQVAGLFMLAEALMYYLILNVWMYTWDFVGLDNIITPIVGLVAIGGGVFFLWEWKTSDGTCKVASVKQRSKTRDRIKRLVEAEMTLLTIFGIIGLALSVNIIEFACSIGIPQAFTKILDLNYLSFIEKQFYMFLYILMYMVDDVIVFGIALYSIEKIGLTQKYSKICNLIGGLLMLLLGAMLIFAPDWLVF